MNPSFLRFIASFPSQHSKSAFAKLLVPLAISATAAVSAASPQIAGELRAHGDSLIGNGIDTATGAFIQGHELLRVEGVRPLSFDITYNSCLTGAPGPVGSSWSHNFQARLEGTPETDVTIHWDAFRTSHFERTGGDPANGMDYRGIEEDVAFATLATQTPHPALPPGSWRLALEDGSTYYFGEDGKLTWVENAVRQGIGTTYDAQGRLSELEEPHSGVKLFLTYNAQGLVETITDDLGREVTLSYDAQANLIRIPAPFLPETTVSGDDFASRAIPDNDPAGIELIVDVPEGGSISGVVLSEFSLTHTRSSDLSLTLTSPSGTSLPITGDATSLSGEFFQGFEGEDRRGGWKLRVADTRAGATGSVSSFKLSFAESSRATTYTYDAAGRITRATDVLGEQLLAATYDSQGRIIRQADGRPETPDATVSYAAVGTDTRTVYTDPTGGSWSYLHDPGFHLLASTTPLGDTTTFTYDSAGNRLTATDALGRTTTFTYNDRGDLATSTDPAGHTTSFTHDFDHQVVEITDALGRETSMLRMDGRLTVVTDALGHTDRKQYHENGQVSKIILADNADVRFDLTPAGRTGRISNPDDTSAEQNLDYDLAGRIIRSKDFSGNVTELTYTPSNDPRLRTDPDGNVSRRDYDHRGRLVRQVGPRGFATTYTHDGNGNILTSTNAIGETTTFTYDHDDRLVTTTNPRGSKITTTYDRAGRPTSTTDPIGRTTRTVYDAVGNVVATYDQEGTRTLRITYDERDLPVMIEDALGHTSTATYDPLGQKISATDALGRAFTFDYDELGRLTKTTDPAGREGENTYLSDDVIKSFQGPGAEEFVATYDRSNNLVDLIDFNGRREKFEYDARNLLTKTITPTGKETGFSYDDLGRLSQSEPVGSLTNDRLRVYGYDPAGNLTDVGTKLNENSATISETSRTYDPAGRLATYTNRDGETLVYLYDPAGNLSGLIYPDGSEVTYGYDPADRLVKVTDWAERVTEFDWDQRDNLTQIRFPNGTRRTMRYDAAGNILFREDTDALGNTIVAYTYSYDAAGRLQSELTAPSITSPAPSTATFTYDNTNRIQTYNGENVSIDGDGNITSAGTGAATETLAYNHRGKLFRTRNYFHFYDAEDQLVGWEPRGGSLSDRSDFFVNPAARFSQILTMKGPGTRSNRYVYGVGLLYEEDTTTGEIRVMHYDQRGSTVALTGNGGQVAGRVSYSDYGEVTSRTGDTDTLFLFNGLYGVVTSPDDLNYMRFRWYSPDLRRFLSKDAHMGSITSLGTLNRYSFAGGNPASYIDPDGELFFIPFIVGGIIAGATVSAGITLVVDIADDGKINTPAEEYIASAIGGAVTGGIVVATGGLGGAVLGGVAGAAAENLSLAALRGEPVDPGELAIQTVIGGASGAGGFGAGKLFGKASNSIYSKTLGKPGKLAKFANKFTVPDKVSRRASGRLGQIVGRSAKKEASQRATTLFLSSAFKIAKSRVFAGIPAITGGGGGGGGGVGGGTGDFSIIATSATELNENRLRRYGEYFHFNLYLDAVTLADLPIPAHPNNALSGF